jgi:hypothetical protein
MKRRPLATKRPASNTPTTELNGTEPSTGDSTEKKWQVDEASGVPAPVIRANSISFRRSFKGRVKVAFFEPE